MPPYPSECVKLAKRRFLAEPVPKTRKKIEQEGIQGSEGRKGLAQWFALETRSPDAAWNGGALRKPEAMHPGCLGHPARDASI